jgi:hypothetical protein
MPKSGIPCENAKEVASKILENSGKGKVVGLCFQSMLTQQKWDETINFDYILDADIDVKVLTV